MFVLHVDKNHDVEFFSQNEKVENLKNAELMKSQINGHRRSVGMNRWY